MTSYKNSAKKKYREKYPEKRKEETKRYYLKNSEKIKDRAKKQRIKNGVKPRISLSHLSLNEKIKRKKEQARQWMKNMRIYKLSKNMKEFIKEQEEELRFKANTSSSLGGFDLGVFDDVAHQNLKTFIARIRKETAETVCDEIIKNIKTDYPGADNNEQHKNQIAGVEYCEKIIKEDLKEIKQQILNNFS